MAIAIMVGAIFGFALSMVILTQFSDWVYYKYYNNKEKKDGDKRG